MKLSVCVLCLTLAVAAPAIAQQPAEAIGHIRNIDGAASIMRDGSVVLGTAGAPLYRDDLIRTGTPGAVGIVLTDDTTVSLGSGSELSLNDYAFEPKEGKFALVMRMIKGTFSFVSGQIVKLAPSAAQLRTPDATIAVRGTKLLIQIGS
jgi:hypothetical protein